VANIVGFLPPLLNDVAFMLRGLRELSLSRDHTTCNDNWRVYVVAVSGWQLEGGPELIRRLRREYNGVFL